MPHLSTYVALADHSEHVLAESFRTVAEGRPDVPDVFHLAHTLAHAGDRLRAALRPLVERYGEDTDVDEPERLRAAGIGEVRAGEVGLVRDLQDLHLLATLARSTWMLVGQGAQGVRDPDLLHLAQEGMSHGDQRIRWLETRMKAAAPQALVVSP